MFYGIGNKFKLPFIFSIGGIGDLLLSVLNGVYDDNNEIGLVFWANSPVVINDVVNDCFLKIKKKVITKNFLYDFGKSVKYYIDIVNDEKFETKCHIPNGMLYYSEWSRITDVFTDYNVKRHPKWVNGWKKEKTNKTIIAPLGGSSDSDWKKKIIKKELLFSLIEKCEHPYLISTEKEMEFYKEDKKIIEDMCTVCYDLTFSELFYLIINSKLVYSVDTWVKTLSLMANVDTILIESYYTKDNMFDPGDNVFLKNWGFKERIKQ